MPGSCIYLCRGRILYSGRRDAGMPGPQIHVPGPPSPPRPWNGRAPGVRPSAYFSEQGPRLSIVLANCHPAVTIRRRSPASRIVSLPHNGRIEPGSIVTSPNANTTFDILYLCETKISRKPSERDPRDQADDRPASLAFLCLPCLKESSFIA